MEIVNNLIKMGLTSGEAKVYVALAEIGSTTVGPIVNKSKVAYSNIYEILNRLIDKGLVSFIIKEKTKYFQAATPNNIKEFLNKKSKEIEAQKLEFERILPELEHLNNLPPHQEAEVFIGLNGLKTAYEKLINGMNENDENIFFYMHKKEYGQLADRFYFSIKDILSKIKFRGICNLEGKDSEFNKSIGKKDKKMEIRYSSFPIPGNWECNRDKLLIISWAKQPVGILIKSKPVADDCKEYFELIWKTAKK